MSAQATQVERSDSSQEPENVPAVSLPESQTTTALALVTQSITELNRLAFEVAALEPKYLGVVFDVKTTAGMKAACEARLAIRKPRYTIQKMQKDAKTPLNALKKGIDDQVDAVIARIAAIEDPIHEQIANEEQRKEDEKRAREAAEAARIAAIQERIDEIRQRPADAVGQSVAEIELYVQALVALQIDDSFAELKQQAEGAKATSLIRLRVTLAKAQALAAEQKRLEDERAENERIRLENEAAAKVERARIAEEERVAREARDAEAARQAEILRQQREENDRIERERQQAREADERRLASERAEAERIEAERKAAADAEAKRLADERAQLERDREALRIAQEPPLSLPPAPVEESPPVPEPPTTETETVASEPEPLLATIDLKVWLAMDAVCKAAQEWAHFQQADSKAAQKADRKLAAEARQAVNYLLIAVEQLPVAGAA